MLKHCTFLFLFSFKKNKQTNLFFFPPTAEFLAIFIQNSSAWMSQSAERGGRIFVAVFNSSAFIDSQTYTLHFCPCCLPGWETVKEEGSGSSQVVPPPACSILVVNSQSNTSNKCSRQRRSHAKATYQESAFNAKQMMSSMFTNKP